MLIYFLENSIPFNATDINSPKIAGTEKTLINITNELAKNTNLSIKVFNKTNACLSLDSHLNKTLKDGDVVKVQKAESKLTLIHPLGHDFFSSSRNKLGWSLGVPKRTKRR